jgi:hypothetical protein
MSTPRPQRPDGIGDDPAGFRLEPDRRYSLVKVGDHVYAFSNHDRYVAALKHVWSADLVPEPLPSALGSALHEVAPNLRGVDPDIDDLRAAGIDDR